MADESDDIARLLGIGDHSMTYSTTGASTTDMTVQKLSDIVREMRTKQLEAIRQQKALSDKLERFRFDPKFWAWVDSLTRMPLERPDTIFGVRLPERPEGM